MNVDQRNNSKLLWIILGAILVVVLLGTLGFWLMNAESKPATTTKPAAAAAQPASTVVAAPMAVPASNAGTGQVLVNEDLLKEEVPQNAALAKEEIARLEDIQKQLQDQEANLKAQHQDADQLIKLKEEQILLLEKQLAEQSK